MCCAPLPGDFPIQGLSPALPHCRWILYHLSHQGSPRILAWVTYLFSRGTSLARNWTGVSCLAMVKRLPAMWETRVQSLGWEDPLEKGMATHSSILAWKIPWIEELGGLQSTASQKVGHDWATSLSLSPAFLGWMNYKLEWRLPRGISTALDMQMIPL